MLDNLLQQFDFLLGIQNPNITPNAWQEQYKHLLANHGFQFHGENIDFVTPMHDGVRVASYCFVERQQLISLSPKDQKVSPYQSETPLGFLAIKFTWQPNQHWTGCEPSESIVQDFISTNIQSSMGFFLFRQNDGDDKKLPCMIKTKRLLKDCLYKHSFFSGWELLHKELDSEYCREVFHQMNISLQKQGLHGDDFLSWVPSSHNPFRLNVDKNDEKISQDCFVELWIYSQETLETMTNRWKPPTIEGFLSSHPNAT